MLSFLDISWIMYGLLLVGCDYALLNQMNKCKPNSTNAYFELYKRLGSAKLSLIRIVYVLSIFYYFLSRSELKNDNAKLIISTYTVVILTLIYSLFFNGRKKS